MKSVTKTFALFFSAILFSACQTMQISVPVTGISLNTSSFSIDVGETYQLTAMVSPSNASNRVVLWSTNDSNVVTVDSNGLVTAIGTGSTVITAKTDDGGFRADCSVQVSSPVADKKLFKTITKNMYTGRTLKDKLTITISYDEQDQLRCLEMVWQNPSGETEKTSRALVDYQENGKAVLTDVFSVEYGIMRRVLNLSLNNSGQVNTGTNQFYSPYGVTYSYDSNNKMTHKEESFMNHKGQDITCSVQCSYANDCLDKVTLGVEGGAYQLSFNYGSVESTEDIGSILAYSVLREATTPDFYAGDLALNLINRFPNNKKLVNSISSNVATMNVLYNMSSDGRVGSMTTSGDGNFNEEYIFSYAECGSQTYTYKEPFTYSGMGGTTWEYSEEESGSRRYWYIVFLDSKTFYFVEDDGCGYQEMIAGAYMTSGSTITMTLSDEEEDLITIGTLSGNTISTIGGYFGGLEFTKTSNFKF